MTEATRQEIRETLYEVFGDEYAVCTLALIEQGRWRLDVDDYCETSYGIWDRKLREHVGVIYLDGHHYGRDVETGDAFDDVIAAAFSYSISSDLQAILDELHAQEDAR